MEKSTRLSESILWDLQNLAYNQFGPEAWGKKGVPFYLTSNPLIAKQFASVVLAYIRDLVQEKKIEFSEVFYIFDLGAGSGKLGYLILKYLIPQIQEIISPDLRICYVMTDVVESNLESCQQHPLLAKYIQSGNLDFALYHHDQKDPITLIGAQKTLTHDVVNPIALICTYYFDTIPQELFKAYKGNLLEGRVTISIPGATSELLSPEMISNLELSTDYVPRDNETAYYLEYPEYNQLLQEYVDLFEDSTFLFPIGGLQSLTFFSQLSKNRLLLLAGDQGVATVDQVRSWGELKICRHASFSLPVSYHLLSKYFCNVGGLGFLTHFPDPAFVVMAGILDKEPLHFSNTKFSFYQELDSLEPRDYFELTNFTSENLATFSLKQLLLYIKLGNFDPVNFHAYFPEILNKLKKASFDEEKYLHQTIYKIWENFYPVDSSEGGFVMNLGVLLFNMKQYKEALFFFEEAAKLAGESEPLLKNIALCRRLITRNSG